MDLNSAVLLTQPPFLSAEFTRMSPQRNPVSRVGGGDEPTWDLCFVLVWFWFYEAGCNDDTEPLILSALLPKAEIT